MISVIIATKNRDAALRDISLPSLLKQDSNNFEVIVWDASDTEDSRLASERFITHFKEKGVNLKYFQAPRSGLPSQRNDAVRTACGELVFFIDDDCEVSPDGLRAVIKCFDNFPECMGVGLVVIEISDEKKEKVFFIGKLKSAFYKIFDYKKKRKVHPSGSNKGMSALPGTAEWLSGGSMAYRRVIFNYMRFNESLEKFGGYAMAEDVEFSHRVFLRYKTPLIVAEEGFVRHHSAAEGRDRNDIKSIAMFFYNRYLVMQAASVRAPLWGRVAFGWNVMRRFIIMTSNCGFLNTKKGFVLAVQQVLNDKKEKQDSLKMHYKRRPK
jgi:glycosyltransferase involved in cell wall biosynthesis